MYHALHNTETTLHSYYQPHKLCSINELLFNKAIVQRREQRKMKNNLKGCMFRPFSLAEVYISNDDYRDGRTFSGSC